MNLSEGGVSELIIPFSFYFLYLTAFLYFLRLFLYLKKKSVHCSTCAFLLRPELFLFI